jgi:rhodanese-related sulfurtransferase
MEHKEHSPGFLALVNEAKTRIKEINLTDYMKLYFARDPHILVDTREESEWKAGHVVGAVHICKGVIERDIEERFPDKDIKLVLYCGGGFRTVLAADNLQKMGYRNTISLAGGWRALKDSGLAVEIADGDSCECCSPADATEK